MENVAIWNVIFGSCLGLISGLLLASPSGRKTNKAIETALQSTQLKTVNRLLKQSIATQYQTEKLTPLAHRLAFVLGLFEWPEDLEYWLDFPNADLHLQALHRMAPLTEKRLHRLLEQQTTLGLLQAYELAQQKGL